MTSNGASALHVTTRRDRKFNVTARSRRTYVILRVQAAYTHGVCEVPAWKKHSVLLFSYIFRFHCSFANLILLFSIMGGSDYCSPFKCTNRRSKRVDLSFHTFPTDRGLRAKWLQALRRADFVTTSHSCLCSEHFTEDRFYPRQPDSGLLLAKKVHRVLRHRAVPTISLFLSTSCAS